jgi:hypothetical protein
VEVFLRKLTLVHGSGCATIAPHASIDDRTAILGSVCHTNAHNERSASFIFGQRGERREWGAVVGLHRQVLQPPSARGFEETPQKAVA